jgi:hypothetical protein
VGTNFTASSTVLFDGVAVATSYESASILDIQLPNSASLVAQHTVQVSDPANGKSTLRHMRFTPLKPGLGLLPAKSRST